MVLKIAEQYVYIRIYTYIYIRIYRYACLKDLKFEMHVISFSLS